MFGMEEGAQESQEAFESAATTWCESIERPEGQRSREPLSSCQTQS
jgi:hypothetical protein